VPTRAERCITQSPTFRTIELRPADTPAPLTPGLYAVRMLAGRVIGIHGPMQPDGRGGLLRHEYVELPYQTRIESLNAVEEWLACRTSCPRVRPRRSLAFALSVGVFASCALSLLLASS
jgi:hypothetical protein